VADVPVGILLSGGIDSSLVTAIATQVSDKPVKTFTISFPDHSGYDEAPFAQIVSDHFGTEHTVLPAETASVDLLPELAGQYDEPLADSSMIPTFLVSRLIRQHATVAIGGDGGDELFAGYIHYSWLLHQETARKYLPAWSRTLVSRSVKACMPVGLRGRSYLLGLEGEVQNSFPFINQFFDCRIRRRLFQPFRGISPHSVASAERFKTGLKVSGRTLVQKATAVDFMTYLADDILVKVDRASMLTSLEVRAPFLDHNIIEFAFSKVPDSLRVNGNDRKILPSLLAQELLPGELDLKRKQGFAIPIAQWFKGEWGTFMKSVLLSGDSWFDHAIVKRLIYGQEHGLANTQRLFALMMFELWRRTYNISL
jgi:asparagine synthase (glutamine-hydrolysing)